MAVKFLTDYYLTREVFARRGDVYTLAPDVEQGLVRLGVAKFVEDDGDANAAEADTSELEQQVQSLAQQVQNLEQQVQALSQRVAAEEQQVQALNQRVVALEERLAGLLERRRQGRHRRSAV